MSISSEISRIGSARDNIAQAIASKGVTVPSGSKIDDMAQLIMSIPTFTSLDAYPVGSIYMSVSSTDPGTIFGGTWIAFGAGRVLVGVDANDADFDTVEETGGAKTHKLVAGELPKISGYAESIMTDGDYTTVKATSPFSWTAGQRTRDYSGEGGSGLRRLNFNIGSDTPHNNLQPYITCYMWKRTA